MQFLKIALHMQWLQSIDYIPLVEQGILVVSLLTNSLYLPLPHHYVVSPLSPLVTTSLLSLSVNLFHFCHIH